jgi:hypothetical protein
MSMALWAFERGNSMHGVFFPPSHLLLLYPVPSHPKPPTSPRQDYLLILPSAVYINPLLRPLFLSSSSTHTSSAFLSKVYISHLYVCARLSFPKTLMTSLHVLSRLCLSSPKLDIAFGMSEPPGFFSKNTTPRRKWVCLRLLLEMKFGEMDGWTGFGVFFEKS